MIDIVKAKEKQDKKSVSFKVKKSTADDLVLLKNRVKKMQKNVEFRLDDVVDDQLKKLIKQANKQLDSLQEIA